MRKEVEISFSDFVSTFKPHLTMYERLVNDVRVGDRFTRRHIIAFYKLSSSYNITPILRDLEKSGIIKIVGKSATNGRSETIFQRIK